MYVSDIANRYSHRRDEALRPVINEVGNIKFRDWIKSADMKCFAASIY